MSKIAFDYISDVHLDSWVHRDGWGSHKTMHDFIRKKLLKRYFSSGPAEQVNLSDTLVIAGDLGHRNGLSELFLRILSDKYYKTILFVPGNHDMASRSDGDMYPSYQERLANMSDRVSKFPKTVKMLYGESIEVDGVVFGGTSGWYDASWSMSKLGLSMEQCLVYYHKWWDYVYIFDSPGFHRMENFMDLFQSEYQKMERLSATSDVMITHIGPSPESMASKYQVGEKAPYSGFFYFDGSRLLGSERPPKVWVFGHTHDGSLARINNTVLLCNPYGYRGENTKAEGILSYIDK